MGLKTGVIIVPVLALLTLTGFCLYRHFVTDQIMDGGSGMENPDAIQLLDGDHTYVDNSILWPVLKGRWESTDGHWQMILGEDTGITLLLDGETVQNGELYFTYLQPGENLQTELEPEVALLQKADGTAFGEITYLCHETGDGDGTLRMEVELPDGTEETVKLQKIKE